MKKIKLTKEQVAMLRLSEKDIKADRLISQERLDKQDRKFLKTESKKLTK